MDIQPNTELRSPVILSEELKNSDLPKNFAITKLYKIKFSHQGFKNCVIFPKSSVAALVYDIDSFSTKCKLKSEIAAIDRFASVHRNSYIVLVAPIFDSENLTILTTLQDKYFFSKVTVLPVHNFKEGVECLSVIATASTKQSMDTMKQRFDQIFLLK